MTAWIAFIVLIVILVAIMMRRIKKNSENTKKVDVFVLSIFVDFIVSSGSHRLCSDCLWFMEFSIVLLCYLLHFQPKFAPILHESH